MDKTIIGLLAGIRDCDFKAKSLQQDFSNTPKSTSASIKADQSSRYSQDWKAIFGCTK